MNQKFDFDNWDEAKEQAAIDAYAASLSRIRHIIFENMLVVELPDKKTASLPLTVTSKDLRDIIVMSDTESNTDAMFALLDKIGAKDTSAVLQGYHVSTVAKVAEVYFETVGKVTGAALGK